MCVVGDRGGDQPLGQVEQPAESRFDETRPQGQRAGQQREPGQSLQRDGQLITGNCGLSLPVSATAISTSMVAANTGAASSSAARKMPPALRTIVSAASRARPSKRAQRRYAEAAHDRGQQDTV